jgi:diaminopimelate epimerase
MNSDMSKIHFYKYQGTGNDFIFIDNRQDVFPKEQDLIVKLCDRKFGIGSDGIVLIQNHSDYDFEMVFYNPDSSQSFCGNASRCAVHFANYLGIIREKAFFLAIDGAHQAFIEDGLIHLRMSDVSQVEQFNERFFINTGSPHYVLFVDELDNIDVYNEGRLIRYSEKYKEKGVNVNFAEIISNDQVYVRTYERGVENETLSCGTGVTAVALAVSTKGFSNPVKIKTKGGELQISFEKLSNQHFTNIYLIGPAIKVFEGEIEV